MAETKKKKWLNKEIVIGFLIGCLLIANIASFLITSLDQFNLFHRYDEAYSLEDWNLAHNVDKDIDGDGKKDKVTFYRCVYMSSINSTTIPQGKQCNTELYEENEIIKVKGYQLPQSSGILINSYIGRNDRTWNIVVNRLMKTELYQITQEGKIIEKEPPFSLRIDSLLYTLSHLIAIAV
jgi:hypothetical protein